jgi:hypothetical protein
VRRTAFELFVEVFRPENGHFGQKKFTLDHVCLCVIEDCPNRHL